MEKIKTLCYGDSNTKEGKCRNMQRAYTAEGGIKMYMTFF